MKTLKKNVTVCCKNRYHLLFFLSMAVSLGGFMLIWGPGLWVMSVGAFVSFSGTFGMTLMAWKLASKRRAEI